MCSSFSHDQESKRCLELIRKTKPKAALAVNPWCIFILSAMCRWDASVAQWLPSVSANRNFGVMLSTLNFGSQNPKEAGERGGEILMLLPFTCPEILPHSARAGRKGWWGGGWAQHCHSKGEMRAQVEGSRMAGSRWQVLCMTAWGTSTVKPLTDLFMCFHLQCSTACVVMMLKDVKE